MRKIQKPLAVLLFAMLVIIGCKRETLPDKSNSQNGQDKTSTSSNGTFKRSAAEMAAAKEKWLRSALSSATGLAARGGCGQHVSSASEVSGITGAFCSSTSSWDIEYTIWSLDWVGSGYATAPVSASFVDASSNSLTATLTNSSANLVDPSCTNWWADGYCLMIREYVYQVSNVPAPASAWPADLGDYTLELLSGFTSTCTPLRVSGDLKGSYTGPDYAAMPARLNAGPTGGPGALYITTDCTSLCPPPNVVCPTGGSLDYWPVSNPSNVTNVTVTAAGNLIFGVPAGTYNYSGTLNYNIGGTPYTSQPKTGSFVIP